MGKLHAIFFSATDTTRRCISSFIRGFEAEPDTFINLADNMSTVFPDFAENDFVVIAVPVYGGRVPMIVADALRRLKGNNATAAAMVVYGNRDIDDALLELTDILHDTDFRIVGAGAFIGEHSIFHKVGKSRPDDSDIQKLIRFAKECKAATLNGFDACIVPYIKGNRPYKQSGEIPFHPKADEKDCVKCNQCVNSCPVNAISADTPYSTDTAKCISCGRCIHVCATGARLYSGVKYSLIGATFTSLYSKRKEPQWIIANS